MVSTIRLSNLIVLPLLLVTVAFVAVGLEGKYCFANADKNFIDNANNNDDDEHEKSKNNNNHNDPLYDDDDYEYYEPSDSDVDYIFYGDDDNDDNDDDNDDDDDDDDDDDFGYPSVSDDDYYYPKPHKYNTKEEYDQDWQTFLRFASNHGSQSELMILLNCSEIHSTDDTFAHTKIPDKKDWKRMNKAYHSTMKKYHHNTTTTTTTKEEEENDISNNRILYDNFPKEFRKTGMTVKSEIRVAPFVGRGIYATEDIAKGTHIWSTANTAEFHSGNAYREYVIELATMDKEAACDAITWSYLVKKSKDKFAICIDMDEGGLFNDIDEYIEENVAFVEEDDHHHGCSGRSMHAIRDIPAGEEFRVFYGTFVYEEWNQLGVCMWEEYPPSSGCEVGAADTYLKKKISNGGQYDKQVKKKANNT